MLRLVKGNGGVLIRAIEAIDGFKEKYDIWPSGIIINEDTLQAIKEHHLTDAGYRRFADFIKVISTTEMICSNQGPSRRIFDYGTEGWIKNRSSTSISEILGFSNQE